MVHTINLSERLQQAASYLSKGARFADIGSDHAYLPCYVCQHDPEAAAIAGEVSKGPYESAARTVASCGLDDRIQVRLGDGLTVLKPGEAEEVVIAGMGGTLIASILERGKDRLGSVQRIIAQPNVDARSVRRWLQKNGYRIVAETIMEEKGHIYEMMAANKSEEMVDLTEREALFGPYLLQERSAAFFNKWASEQMKLERVLSQMKQATEQNEEKKAQFLRELDWIKEVLSHGDTC